MKIATLRKQQAMEHEKYEVAIKCREIVDAYLATLPKDERDAIEEEIQTLIFVPE